MMNIAYKRGRLPAKTKKRLKYLADEIREQRRLDKEMEKARQNRAYQTAVQIKDACSFWYSGEVSDATTVMDMIQFAVWWRVSQEEVPCPPLKRGEDKDYDNSLVEVRHDIRAHDEITANLFYLIDNAIGLWADGYYSDKLAINLIDDYATVLMSGFSGRKMSLEHRPGRGK